MQQYQIIKGLKEPWNAHPKRRKSFDDLLILAGDMEIGDAAVLTQAEAQTFRTILMAQGYRCVTDGYRCEVRGKTLAFKLEQPLTVHREPDDFKRCESELCTDCRQPTRFWLTPHVPLCEACCEIRNKAKSGARRNDSSGHPQPDSKPAP